MKFIISFHWYGREYVSKIESFINGNFHITNNIDHAKRFDLKSARTFIRIMEIKRSFNQPSNIKIEIIEK